MTEPSVPADPAQNNDKIILYGTSWCPDSHRARRVIEAHRVDYVYIDIDQHPDAVAVVLHINNGSRSVPTIVFPDGSTLTEPSNRTLEAQLVA